MEPNAPGVNLTDSVQVGHNAIGPSTGDIVINSGNQIERCSMCKTPIDAKTNPGLYCFKEGCDTLFAKTASRFSVQNEGLGKNRIVQSTSVSSLGRRYQKFRQASNRHNPQWLSPNSPPRSPLGRHLYSLGTLIRWLLSKDKPVSNLVVLFKPPPST